MQSLRNMLGTVRHLLLCFRNTTSNSHHLFSSSATVIQRPLTHSDDKACASELKEEIGVYNHALKIQRPTTVSFENILYKFNHVSFIGTIDNPLKTSNLENMICTLNVKTSNNGYSHFRVLLTFLGEMRKMSIQYLKPGDLIFVSGRLKSYTKNNQVGKPQIFYKVNVAEVDFVVDQRKNSVSQTHMKWESKLSPEEMKQRRRDRLHLWHVLFACPDEWWDNRDNKLYPTAPDFKHKDTDEKLWLKDTDPPWVRQQLDLLDSRLGKRSAGGVRNARLHLSPLFYDDPK